MMTSITNFLHVLLASVLISSPSFAQPDDKSVMSVQEPKYHFKKEHYAAGSSSGALLTYRGGKVLRTSATMAIFWGPEWTDSTFAKDKIAGLNSFFAGFSNSRYASTASEYSDTTGGITSQSTYLGSAMDTSAPPRKQPKTSTIVAEVCKMTGNQPNPDAVYFVYTSSSAQGSYCAWHSYGNCSNGAPVQVAYMPTLDGIAGCDPQDNVTGHSQGLAALANVTAHELMEGITDPRSSGWLDSSGEENGDKCAWSFPPGDGTSTFSNGSVWKIQMEWSNSAYVNGTGAPNTSGQKACIY